MLRLSKNSIGAEASYARGNQYFHGWTFLNHISLLYYYSLIDAIRTAVMEESLTPKEAILITKNICQISDRNGNYHLSKIKDRTQETLSRLCVDLSVT